jgi:hypothetical protein
MGTSESTRILWPLKVKPIATISAQMKPQYLPVAGAVALLVGSFLPVYSLPLLGNVTWIANGETFGTATVLLAVVTAALSALQKHRLVWVTGWLHLALLVLGLAGFYWQKGELGAAALPRSGSDALNLSRLEAAYYDAIQLAWGWCVLFLGAGLVIYGAILAARDEAAQRVQSARA